LAFPLEIAKSHQDLGVILADSGGVNAILITAAFALGFVAKQFGLTPMVGFLLAGFVLRAFGFQGDAALSEIAGFGITLLLFTIGLKLKITELGRPVVWAGTSIHLAATMLLIAAACMLMGSLGVPLFDQLDFRGCLLIGFALSFSSTVFAIKAFDERAEIATRHASTAIAILIMQDIVAVAFLSLTAGAWPSPWTLALLAVPLVKKPLFSLLQRVGHGELLLLLGFVLPLAGYGLFTLLGLKGDLGALAMGMLLATHPKAGELAKSLFGFKDIFLVAFFLEIGLTQGLTLSAVAATAILILLLAVKMVAYFFVFTGFRFRARPAFLATLGLSNFSEFGLIVGAVAASAGWLDGQWLVVFALLLAVSFVAAAPLNTHASALYTKSKKTLARAERKSRLPEDMPLATDDAEVVIFGMGRIGVSAYDTIASEEKVPVIGVDSCPEKVRRSREAGRSVILGDGTDEEFWERLCVQTHISRALIATANHRANVQIAQHLRARGYNGTIASLARFSDEAAELSELGVDAVFNIYDEAGVAFAEHAARERLLKTKPTQPPEPLLVLERASA
jgi:predicted Kef-type K+ transport protein